MIAREISSLQAEQARLDRLVADFAPKVGDEALPCWECGSPQAADARHWLGANQSGIAARSASGLPYCCCRVVMAQTGTTIVHYA
jgi:hypothetical protein